MLWHLFLTGFASSHSQDSVKHPLDMSSWPLGPYRPDDALCLLPALIIHLIKGCSAFQRWENGTEGGRGVAIMIQIDLRSTLRELGSNTNRRAWLTSGFTREWVPWIVLLLHDRILDYFHEELTPVRELLYFFVLFSGSAPSFHLNL